MQAGCSEKLDVPLLVSAGFVSGLSGGVVFASGVVVLAPGVVVLASGVVVLASGVVVLASCVAGGVTGALEPSILISAHDSKHVRFS